MDSYLYTIAITVIVGFFAIREFTKGPGPYRGRKCMGKAWKSAFPNSNNNEIRLFLECFVNGMALSSKTRLKFQPNDQVIDVYRSLYSGRTPLGDNMECETFLENLSRSFTKELKPLLELWREDITLGEYFEFVRV